MRLAEIAREAWRNVAGGTARAGVCALTSCLLLGALMYLEGDAVADHVAAARHFHDVGGATWIAEAPAAIDPITCTQLGGTEGVSAAAPMRVIGSATVIATPRQPLPLNQAGPGMARILGVPEIPGLYVSAAAASTYAIIPGSTLTTTVGPLPVVAIFDWPDDGRGQQLSAAAIWIGPTDGLYDQCWATFDPVDPGKRALLSITVEPRVGGQSQIRQLTSRYGENPQFSWYFDNRITRWAPLAAFLLTAILTGSALWLRKVELATNQHFGMTRTAQCLQYLLETALWVLPVLAICGSALLLWALLIPPYPALAIYPAASLAAGLAGAATGSVLTPLAVRERSISTYVKTR